MSLTTDALALLFVGALAGLATWWLALAISRANSLARLREAFGAPEAADLEVIARSVIDGRQEAEWRASQARDDMVRLSELVSVGVVHLDDDLVVDRANQAAHAILGRRPDGLEGMGAVEAFADARIEGIAEAAREAGFASGEVVIGSDRQVVLVRARRSPVAGVWMVLEDVSELRRLQRIRAEFIDNLSHELRTPLTNIRLLAETLTRDAERAALPDGITERITSIDVESLHLVQMVNELLDLSKIEHGAAELRLRDVDIRTVVRAALERLRLFAERQGVTLRAEVADDLPAARADEERLGQLLLNLLHNAVKFSPAGREVVVRARAEPDEVVVSVADQGPGIPAGDLERIFERFYKVDKARLRRAGGTGLGLAIARHIAEGHGGRIWAESREGEGATFSFAVPVSRWQ